MKKQKRILNEQGFTLVEIIAVLVILGIMAAVAVPKYFDMEKAAEQKTLKIAHNDMKSRAVNAYSKSMLLHDGVPDNTEYDEWEDLGFTSDNDVNYAYKDFAGTWDLKKNNGEIVYTMQDGTTTFTFTLKRVDNDERPAPYIVNVDPDLSEAL